MPTTSCTPRNAAAPPSTTKPLPRDHSMVAASEAHYHPITVACCSDADAGARVLLLGHLAPFHHLALSLPNITRPLAAQNVADLQLCHLDQICRKVAPLCFSHGPQLAKQGTDMFHGFGMPFCPPVHLESPPARRLG